MATIESIEEKAKAYDMALENAKHYHSEMGDDICCVLEECFPELKESEDEKIRKEILSYIKSSGAVTNPNWIAWLEKKGEREQNVTDIISDLENYFATTTKEQRDFLFQKMHEEGYEWDDEKKELKKIEQKSTWSDKYIADVFEKVGLAKIVREQANDKLTRAVQDVMIELSKSISQQNITWSEEDERMIKEAIRMIAEPGSFFKGTELTEKVVSWLKSLKDRVQPKQEWSKEDGEMVEILNEYVNNLDIFFSEIKIGDKDILSKEFREKVQHWLKSLKDRYTWKPSDEQMKFLWKYAEQNNYDGAILTSLFHDLKKLMEE